AVNQRIQQKQRFTTKGGNEVKTPSELSAGSAADGQSPRGVSGLLFAVLGGNNRVRSASGLNLAAVRQTATAKQNTLQTAVIAFFLLVEACVPVYLQTNPSSQPSRQLYTAPHS